MHRALLLAAALLVSGLAASSIDPSARGSDPEAMGTAVYALAGPSAGTMDADLSLSIAANVSAADPGDSVTLSVSASNEGDENATNAIFVTSLDPNSTYVSSLPNATYDPLNRTLQWTVASLAVGDHVNLSWTIRVRVGTLDNTPILNLFRASYRNETGTPLPPEEASISVRVTAPVFAPVIRPVPARAGRGDVVVAKLYVNNTGSGTALRAWSNWTLAGHFRFEYLEEAFPVTNVSNGFRVMLSNLGPGSHALTAHLVVLRGLDDGLSMPIQSQWTATDGNGNLLAPSTPGTAITLLAPRFTIAVNSSAVRVNATTRFVLNVTLWNTGRAPGIGWLNMTVPNGASFITDNASFPRSNRGKQYTWTLPSVSAGSAVILGVTFESAEHSRVASFAFVFEFTDGKGSPSASIADNLDVEIVIPESPAGSANFTTWIALAAAAGGSAAIFAWWRRRRASDIQIEDVFVADMAGHLLAHRSSGLVAYEDEDILVGMFKVIQDFVKDSFAKGTNDTMKSMEFGSRKIIIERGAYHFISVVFRGRDRGSLADRVRKVSRLIDHRFGRALESWSGDLDELRGLANLLPLVWKHGRRSRAIAGAKATPKAGPQDPRTAGGPGASGSGPADSGGIMNPVEPRK